MAREDTSRADRTPSGAQEPRHVTLLPRESALEVAELLLAVLELGRV
jgi:hypothetical protein